MTGRMRELTICIGIVMLLFLMAAPAAASGGPLAITHFHSSPTTDPLLPPEYLSDNDPATAWGLLPGAQEGWVELDLGGEALIYGLKIEGILASDTVLRLEYRSGGAWRPFLLGRLGELPPDGIIDLSVDRAVADGLRLRLSGAGTSFSRLAELLILGTPRDEVLFRLGPKIIGSSMNTLPGFPARFLIDGNTRTSWFARGRLHPGHRDGTPDILEDGSRSCLPWGEGWAEAVFDLGESHLLRSAAIYLSSEARGLILLQAEAGKAYPELGRLEANGEAGWKRIELNGVSARRLRLVVEGREEILGGLGELVLFGTGPYPGDRHVPLLHREENLTGPLNLEFTVDDPRAGGWFLEFTCADSLAEPLAIDLNGREFLLEPSLALNGQTLYELEVPEGILLLGPNFLRIKPGSGRVLGAAFLARRSGEGIPLPASGLSDRLFLTTSNTTPELIIPLGAEVLLEEVRVFAESGEGIEVYAHSKETWVPLEKVNSGFPLRFAGPILAHELRILNPYGVSLSEVVLLGSPTTDGPPKVEILHPEDGACLPMGAIGREEVFGFVDDHKARLEVNGLPVELDGHFFRMRLAHLHPAPWESLVIEAVAYDAQGREGKDRIEIAVGEANLVELDGPEWLVRTTDDTHTISGRVLRPGVKVEINGTEVPVVHGRFRVEVPLQEGFNRLTVTASFVSPGGKKEFRQTVTRAVVRESDEIEVVVNSPEDGSYLKAESVTVTGWVKGPPPIRLTVNGLPAEISPDGSFRSKPIPLAEGENRIAIEARTRDGRIKQVELVVFADRTPPLVTLLAPAEGAVLNTAEVKVEGRLEEANPACLLVNGRAAEVVNGEFSLVLTLPEGENRISIQARDLAGNTAGLTRTVTVDLTPPLPFSLSGPTGYTNQNRPEIGFAARDEMSGIAAYYLRLDGGDWWGPVTSPHRFAEPLPDGAHVVEVKAVDRAGWETVSAPLQFIVDTVAPEAPAIVRVIPGNGWIKVAWKLIVSPPPPEGGEPEPDPPDPVMLKYLIERNPAFESGQALELGDIKEYLDAGLENGTTYGYRVAVVDLAGNVGVWSEWFTAEAGVAVVSYEPETGTVIEYGGLAMLVPADDLPAGKDVIVTEFECPTMTADNLDPADPTRMPSTLPTGAQYLISPIYLVALRDTETGEIESRDLEHTMMAKIAYDPARIPGDFPEENLAVYWFDPVFSHWFEVPSVVDTEKNEVYFWTNHFTSSFSIQPTVVQDLSPEEYRDMGISPLKTYATQGPVNVSPMGGAVSTRAVDLVLPGEDGNELVIARTYDSMTARADAMGLEVSARKEIRLGYYSNLFNDFESAWSFATGADWEIGDSLTNLVKRIAWAYLWCQGDAAFSPGQGWRLEFPYIKLMGSGAYLRMPSGAAYEIHSARIAEQKLITDIENIAYRELKLINEEGEYFTLYIKQVCFKHSPMFNIQWLKNLMELIPSWVPLEYRLVLKDGTTYYFDMFGRPTKQLDSCGRTVLDFTYQGITLDTITDSVGREIGFDYVGGGINFPRVSRITINGDAPYNRKVVYEIDTKGLLTKATDPGGRHTEYTYESKLLFGADASVTINILAVLSAILAPGTPVCDIVESIFGPSVDLRGAVSVQFAFPMREIKPQYGGRTVITYEEKLASRIDYWLNWFLFIPVSFTIAGEIETRLLARSVSVYEGTRASPALVRNYSYTMKPFDIGQSLVDLATVTDGNQRVEYHYITKRKKRTVWEDSSVKLGEYNDGESIVSVPFLTPVFWRYEEVALNDYIITKDQATGAILEIEYLAYDDEQGGTGDLGSLVEDGDNQASLHLTAERTICGAAANGGNERLVLYAHDDYGNVTYLKDTGGIYKQNGQDYPHDDREVWTKYVNSTPKPGAQPSPPPLAAPPFPAPSLPSTFRGLIQWQVEKVYTPLGPDGRPGYRLLQTFYDYNSYGQVTRKAVWDGERWRITRYTYDPETCYLVETVEPDGQVTQFTYDDWGFPRAVVKKDVRDADGVAVDIVTRTGYDRMTGWKIWEKDGRGYVTEYRYDALGRVVATVLPDDDDDVAWDPASGPSPLRANNPVQRVVFDDLVLKTTVIDPLGNKVTYDYDTRGYLVEIVKSTKAEERYAVTRLTYDAYGRIIEIVDPNGNAPGVTDAYKYTTRYEYDALGNLKKVIYPDETPAWTDNPTKTYLRDLVAMKTTITDEEGKITEQYHDMEGRILKEVKLSYQGNIETVTVYDGAGNKVELTDPRGYVTRMYYDALNQLVRVEMPRDTFWENGAQVTVTPVITYAYDLAGNRTAETREAGGGRTHTVTTVYDGLRRPISVVTTFTDRDGTVKTAGTKTYYDANGNKVKVVDANNAQKPEAERKCFTYTYSARGWLLAETDPEGHTISYTYDPAGNRTSLTDGRGNATETPNDYTIRYEYDDLYRLVRAVLPDETPSELSDNPVVRFTYDQRGTNLSKETRPNESTPGQLTTYEYYPRYRVKTETISAGGQSLTTSYTYDKVGNLKTVTDPRGQTTTYEYDDFHRKTRAVYPEGNTESYEYDKAGNMTALVDGRGRITRYAYNSQNKLISVTDAGGAVTSYGYDRWGNQTRMERPEGQVTTYVYDELNRLIKVTDPLGFETLYGYDLVGNRIYAKDPNGNESFYTYDADNLLKRILVLNGLEGKCLDYEYDPAHQQLSAMQYIAHLAEGMSEPTLTLESRLSRTYTVLGQVASETRQAAGLPARTVTYAYDYLGNISSMLYPEATQPLEYNYNDLGQLVEIPNFIPSITYRDGLPRTVRYANGVTLSYTYDRNGRLDTRTDTHNGTQLFSLDLNYDANGNIVSRNVNGQVNTYAYDDLNQLVHADVYARQSEQVRVSDYGLGQVQEDYRGDKVVEVQSEDFEVNLDYAATSLSVIFNQVAERIQRIELVPQEATHRVNNKRYLAIYCKTSGDYRKLDPADWEFGVDTATGRITITFPHLVTAYEIKIHCLFDDRDKDYLPVKKRGATSEFANLARSMVRVYRVYERRYEDYIYARNGNRMSETITTLYPRTYGYTYYPNSDRLKTREASDGTTKWAFVYDNNGNLIEKGNTYTITGDIVVFTTGGEGVVYWQYEYDVFNRLVSVKKNGLVVSRYVYDPSGLRIVKEAAETRIYDYDLAGNVIGEKNLSTGKVYSYIWVTGRHLARVDGVIGGTGEKYFYERDHLGSPMVVTDQGGQVVWRGDFAPFGEKIKGEVEAGVFVDTHGFTGKDWDEDVGLYYFNARWYDPELGRFISEDPLHDGANWYIFGANNPIRYTDPSGTIHKESGKWVWDDYDFVWDQKRGSFGFWLYNDEFFTEGWWEDPTKLALAWKFLEKADFEAKHKWVREEPFTKEYTSKYWEIRRVQTVQAKMGVEVTGWFDDRTDFAFEALTDILQIGGFDTAKIRRNVFGSIMWHTLEVINGNESVKELYRKLIHYKEAIREFEWAVESLAQFFITLGVSQYFASLKAANTAKFSSNSGDISSFEDALISAQKITLKEGEYIVRYLRQSEFELIQSALKNNASTVTLGRFMTMDGLLDSSTAAAAQYALPNIVNDPVVGYVLIPAKNLAGNAFMGPSLVRPDFGQIGFGTEIQFFIKPTIPAAGLQLVRF